MRRERGQYQPEQVDRQSVFIRASREQSGLMKGKRGSVRTQERNKGPTEMGREIIEERIPSTLEEGGGTEHAGRTTQDHGCEPSEY